MQGFRPGFASRLEAIIKGDSIEAVMVDPSGSLVLGTAAGVYLSFSPDGKVTYSEQFDPADQPIEMDITLSTSEARSDQT